ncbi:hypothetical protein [Paenibacillus silvisoli]|uniref:hypothetical protein n=1 Tax=Paenibacillus silvisoli TaxID=3110539 RepID=UPI0028041656|nr:hypothetical protein [Paenibacillus silvisoli]
MKEDQDSATNRINAHMHAQSSPSQQSSGHPAKLLKFALLLAVPVALSGCNTTSYGCDPNYEDCDDYSGGGGSSGVYYSGSGSSTKSPSYNSGSGSSGSSSFKGFGSSGSHSSGG